MPLETLPIVKLSDEHRIVYGWANVTVMAGENVVDSQNDTISSDTLIKAFEGFMASSRVGGVMHLRDKAGAPVGVGEVIFAWPFTAELKKAMGIDIPQEGVMIGLKVRDDKVWAAVKAGDLKAFSIAGKAKRVLVAEAA